MCWLFATKCYQSADPSKLGKIDELTTKYYGDELRLLKAMENKYSGVRACYALSAGYKQTEAELR